MITCYRAGKLGPDFQWFNLGKFRTAFVVIRKKRIRMVLGRIKIYNFSTSTNLISCVLLLTLKVIANMDAVFCSL
jgi:hypothetical protein